MVASLQKIQADFDRIAVLSADEWNHNSHYYDFLLRQLPPRCGRVLEIGCGIGTFSRLLAKRSDHVLAIDLAPKMIQIAKECFGDCGNVDFQVADAVALNFATAHFDCVASIATLHHVPLMGILCKMKDALKVNGTLLVLDLFQTDPFSLLSSTLAMPASFTMGLLKNRRLRASRELREAWADHARHDAFPGMTEVRQVCAEVLPGAKVRRHLLWRYSITWTKTESVR
jgi:ubiquinone/menaquinone biosynthesis C-methylase UbiE